ncbi:MAG TPA: AI-2E family transporter, partial [Terriglobales bacterium]|nr:AI-2E family transporter [Terriglobales bacterium]
MRRQQLFAAFFFTVFLFLLYQFYVIFQGFFGPLSWAGVLVLVFYPVYAQLERLLKGRAGLASFILTTAVIATVIVPTIILTTVVVQQSVQFVQSMQHAYETGELQQQIVGWRDSAPGRLWDRFSPLLSDWNVDLGALALKASNAASGFLVEQAGHAAANVLKFVGNFFLTTLALFFFFRDGERLVRGFRDLLPMEPKHKDAILQRFYDTLSAVVQGTLATAVAQGVLAGIGYAIAGVPFSFLLGAVTGFSSFVPFGPPLVWISVVAYLLIKGAIGWGIFLLIWSILL